MKEDEKDVLKDKSKAKKIGQTSFNLDSVKSFMPDLSYSQNLDHSFKLSYNNLQSSDDVFSQDIAQAIARKKAKQESEQNAQNQAINTAQHDEQPNIAPNVQERSYVDKQALFNIYQNDNLNAEYQDYPEYVQEQFEQERYVNHPNSEYHELNEQYDHNFYDNEPASEQNYSDSDYQYEAYLDPDSPFFDPAKAQANNLLTISFGENYFLSYQINSRLQKIWMATAFKDFFNTNSGQKIGYSYDDFNFEDEIDTQSGKDIVYDSNKSILRLALYCPFINKYDVAVATYLEQEYRLDDKDQDRFNLILLALAARMNDGDVCLNLNSKKSLYEVCFAWQNHVARIDSTKDIEEKVSQYDLENIKKFSYKAELLLKQDENIQSFIDLIKKSKAVGQHKSSRTPLIFNNKRLYFRRYFQYELNIGNYFSSCKDIEHNEDTLNGLKQAIDLLFPYKEELAQAKLLDFQKIAAIMATRSKFTVISGGPGTGKTTTVLKVLVLLIALNLANSRIQLCAPTGKATARMIESISEQMKNETMLKNIEDIAKLFNFSAEEIKEKIPTTASTVQSFIKVTPHQAKPIYNAQNKVLCDILIVDEVSMLDMALFSKLLDAIDENCHVILLGDKDQLSSVEAGSVLADLCSRLDSTSSKRLSSETLEYICYLSGYTKKQILSSKIAEHIALLQYSYRSKNVPAIGDIAQFINATSLDNQEDYLNYENYKLCNNTDLWTVSFSELTKARFDQLEEKFVKYYEQAINSPVNKLNIYKYPVRLELISTKFALPEDLRQIRLNFIKYAVDPRYEDNFAPFLRKLKSINFLIRDDFDPNFLKELFTLMDRYRVLCATHKSFLGDRCINTLFQEEILEQYLRPLKLKRKYKDSQFYPGQIVIITKNDKLLRVNNGDVGFCALYKEKDEDPTLKVFFPDGVEEDNHKTTFKFKMISTMLLNDFDSGFAMSIHKSQGSEYNKVSIMLSLQPSLVLNKELIYTAVTRAKNCVELISSEESLKYCLSHSINRQSGLVDRLN